MKRIAIGLFILFLVLPSWSFTWAQPRPNLTLAHRFWQRQDRTLFPPPIRLLSSAPDASVKVVWSGGPFTTPRGIVRAGNALYVADPGRSAKPGVAGIFSPARIIRFPLIGNRVGEPEIFFEDESFLINAKWIAHPHGSRQDILYVADQGEELPGFINTGKGAKVFRLPILPNGRAGKPFVLHEGAPFVCPTGITVIPPYVFVADSCAGGMRNRVEMPGRFFPSSIIYAVPINGGKPIRVWEGSPLTTAIGLCDWHGYGANRRIYLVVNDLNSGRLNWKRKDFPSLSPEAGAEIWLIPILSLSPLKAGPPEKLPITEEGTVQIRLPAIPPGGRVVVGTRNGTRFPNGGTKVTLAPYSVGPDGVLTLTVVSPADQDSVDVEVSVFAQSGDLLVQAQFQVQKDPDQDVMFGHNKHGGLITPPLEEPPTPQPRGSPSSSTPLHFTVDEGYEAGMGTIWIYQPGATPVVLARGDPMRRPLAGEVSVDGTVLWVTDQAGALLELAVPKDTVVRRLFPYTTSRGRN